MIGQPGPPETAPPEPTPPLKRGVTRLIAERDMSADDSIHSLWETLARCHQDAPDNPAANPFQVFNRTADDLARALADPSPGTSGLSDVWSTRGRSGASSQVGPAACADCGASDLEHFYTSKWGGEVLCPGCFQRRNPQGVASP